MCLKLIPRVTPLNARELKVLEGTHGTKPMELLGGEVGLETHITPPPPKKKEKSKILASISPSRIH